MSEGREIITTISDQVEPAFGIIKQVMGFRQFLLREGWRKFPGKGTRVPCPQPKRDQHPGNSWNELKRRLNGDNLRDFSLRKNIFVRRTIPGRQVVPDRQDARVLNLSVQAALFNRLPDSIAATRLGIGMSNKFRSACSKGSHSVFTT